MCNVVAAEKYGDWGGFLTRLPLAGLSDRQQAAVNTLLRHPVPSRKDEDWKYSDVRWIKKLLFSQPLKVGNDYVRQMLDRVLFDTIKDFPRIVTVNGELCLEHSTIMEYPEYFLEHGERYDHIANPEADVMTALNFAMGQDTIRLGLSEGQDGKTVVIINLGYAMEKRSISFHPRYLVDLPANTRLSVIEISSGEGCYFSNPVYEIQLAAHADFHYTQINQASLESYNCSNTYVHLSEHANFQQFSMIKGTMFSRQEVVMDLKGTWSKVGFDAIQVLSHSQHADITSKVFHRALHCQSEQNVKNILSDHSHGVFQGKILVECIAQKTNAQQQNQALLLSDDAGIDTKPELEIYADDVKCSHGAAIGALDQEQLFFLMSRGIPYDMARKMLITAFIMGTVEKVSDPVVRDLLSQYLLL